MSAAAEVIARMYRFTDALREAPRFLAHPSAAAASLLGSSVADRAIPRDKNCYGVRSKSRHDEPFLGGAVESERKALVRLPGALSSSCDLLRDQCEPHVVGLRPGNPRCRISRGCHRCGNALGACHRAASAHLHTDLPNQRFGGCSRTTSPVHKTALSNHTSSITRLGVRRVALLSQLPNYLGSPTEKINVPHIRNTVLKLSRGIAALTGTSLEGAAVVVHGAAMPISDGCRLI
jgi:hypothetical protein